MYTRSELRHACYRMKKKVATTKNKEVAALISEHLNDTQTWDNFSTVWDVMLDLKKKIVIIKPETDIRFVTSVCSEMKVLTKNKLPTENLSDRHLNVVHTIESLMLDGIMKWENFSEVWDVYIDDEQKLIQTKLIDVEPNQIPVTEAMIAASRKIVNTTPAKTNSAEVEMSEPVAMSADEIAKFEKILAQMKNKG